MPSCQKTGEGNVKEKINTGLRLCVILRESLPGADFRGTIQVVKLKL